MIAMEAGPRRGTRVGSGVPTCWWLLDRSMECVDLVVDASQVTIILSGNRDDLRHVTTVN
ncbi:hypothetical protein [Micromonospora sp. NPDC048898]|uniref:hypothetical protein n=1 Tax=Micromonospora sp. NPDC048898 TaxID=3364260 RepID=UPI0037226C12